jgi:hypothetical protein
MSDILEYSKKLSPADQEICELLRATIEKELPKATGKVWHGHPVWFIDGNPIVGYHRQKASLRILFWSGQSFDEPALEAIGKFKAAGMAAEALETFDLKVFKRSLKKSKTIQWDYANLPKKRKLVKLTDF